ncbi:type II CRISPR RNA-guided endonuclease Cas9 [Arcobacter defluvii]|uniref:CRISPR-associated endonuclease Cas9 n=1 Tax=Arcobacter defluvii TaxID=873191 RepID=A0AAE7BDC7_9BACT|nr:type II CRISPR RNA-guided endonuclease Cas9 [Arcobacter defluvii]QKF77370.1 CRISPR/Cas system-associated RNA-guided endonuclease Cas9, type II-C [Arcobacter defluvii]RXI29055.1 type II CRISPR RNA-guided endonuclease Cas9 [Arcobacter defluvii]
MNRILSLDLGVTSCGFSVLDEVETNQYSLIDYGVVMRDNPNEGGTQSDWKAYIQQRKLKDKKKQRVKDLKDIFKSFNLNFVEKNYSNLWELRAKDSFERKLQIDELFAIFRYLAKHRGYKSLKMEDLIAEIESQEKIGNCESDDVIEPNSEEFTETLAYLDALKCKFKEKTVAQIIYDIESQKENPNFRNHNNYKYMIRREDTKDEIEKIVEAQKLFGFFKDEKEAENFKNSIIDEIIPQDPVLLNPNLINNCLIYKEEKSAPIYSYSFDIFNFYKHINDLKIGNKNATNEQKEILTNDFELKLKELKNISSYTIKGIKELLDIKDDIKISGLRETKIVKGKSVDNYLVKFNFLAHWAKFDKEIVVALKDKINYFDKIATIFHININPNALIEGFSKYFKENNLFFEEEKIKNFALSLYKNKVKGTSAYSFKALNDLIVHMKDGKNESDAKEILGVSKSEDYSSFEKSIKYLKPIDKNGTLRYEIDENSISNHVVKSLISWACRIIIDLHEKYGSFDMIKLESTRELSQPDEKKREIKSANDRIQKEWEDLKDRYKSHFEALGLNMGNNKEYLLKIKLWEQQGEIGIYSGQSLGIVDILSDKTEIEHIVPRECGGANAEYNKAIDTKNENAIKARRLPLDYLVEEKREVFLQNIDELKNSKKINFKKWLNLKAQTLDETFKEVKDDVSMHATSYTEKLLGEILKRYYPFTDKQKENQKVMHISGRATSYLRKILSIENKSRGTNFHHAEDAILIACMSKSYLQNISTNFEKNYELTRENAKDNFKKIVPFINGANPNEIFSYLQKSYTQDIEENPFYTNVIDNTLRIPAFWVSKKPIGTKAHNETIQSKKNLAYRVNIDSLLERVKPNHKMSAESFFEQYNKEILEKIQVFKDNPKDFTAQAFIKKRDNIIQLLQEANFITSKDEKADIDKKLRDEMKKPIEDVNGNTIRRVKRVGEDATIEVRNGLAYTAPSLVCLRCSFDEPKLQLQRIDIRSHVQNRNKNDTQIDIFNNDLIEIYVIKSKKIEYKAIGVLKGFTESKGGRANLRNPKYPLLKDKQPKLFQGEFSIGSTCGIKKYKTDASGRVLGFYYLGRVLEGDKEVFSKVVTYRKM